jgi:hypothetical protein
MPQMSDLVCAKASASVIFDWDSQTAFLVSFEIWKRVIPFQELRRVSEARGE